MMIKRAQSKSKHINLVYFRRTDYSTGYALNLRVKLFARIRFLVVGVSRFQPTVLYIAENTEFQ